MDLYNRWALQLKGWEAAKSQVWLVANANAR